MPGELLLNSWKEIASYMGRSERTVQRWERQFGLPIRRPAGRSRSAVIALPADIETWSRNAPTRSARTWRGCTELHEKTPSIEKDPDYSRPTLLCIDNRAEGLALRKALLEALGYHVLTALGGKSGLRMFERNTVDLVVLEPTICDLTGDTMLQRLREIKPRVPILLLSRGVRAVSLPMLKLVDNFVHKEQPVATLLRAINELCSSVRQTVPEEDCTGLPISGNEPAA